MKKVFVSVCLTILSAVGTANAALVSYTDSYSYSNYGTSSNLLLNCFNPALGTLTGISLTSTTQLKAGVSITNNSNNQFQLNYSPIITSDPAWYASFPSGSSLYYDSGSFNKFNGVVGVGKTAILWEPNSHNMTQSINIAPDSWSSYEGTGSITVNSGISNSGSYYGGKIIITPVGMASGGVTINYTYEPTPTPTPIPPAFLLMGSGLVGMVAYRRRLVCS